MKFELKTKHSLSNKYNIEDKSFLDKKNFIGFNFGDNEIYLNKEFLEDRYQINQDMNQIRSEVINAIISDLNEINKFDEIKISKLIDDNEKIKGGYKISDTLSGIYVKNLEIELCEIFFDKHEQNYNSEIQINNLIINTSIIIGSVALNKFEKIKENKLYNIKPSFKVMFEDVVLFDYILGLNEIMVMKGNSYMNIENEIGENATPDIENLPIILDIVLGDITMSVAELKELLVGDFINIDDISFNNIQIKFNKKKIALGELVYNENEKLAVEIKEVFL